MESATRATRKSLIWSCMFELIQLQEKRKKNSPGLDLFHNHGFNLSVLILIVTDQLLNHFLCCSSNKTDVYVYV